MRFTGDQLARKENADMSLHDLGIAETLEMTKLLGCEPQTVVFIGIKPADLTPGLKLSKQITEIMDKAVELVLQEIPRG
jgi:hydrogenase maturation protease